MLNSSCGFFLFLASRHILQHGIKTPIWDLRMQRLLNYCFCVLQIHILGDQEDFMQLERKMNRTEIHPFNKLNIKWSTLISARHWSWHLLKNYLLYFKGDFRYLSSSFSLIHKALKTIRALPAVYALEGFFFFGLLRVVSIYLEVKYVKRKCVKRKEKGKLIAWLRNAFWKEQRYP